MHTEPSRKVGALLVHGLGGTQYDLGNLPATLNRAGIATHVPLLPGHGTRPEDLRGVRAEDWLAHVRAEYRRLRPLYDELHVIGMCMGALLCLQIAHEERHHQGQLILLAPSVYLDGWATPWYRALRYLGYCLPWVPGHWRVDEDEPFGIKNPMMRKVVKSKLLKGESFHYLWVPLYCIRQMDRMRRRVMRDLRPLDCDTLVVHAREDEVTSLRSAHFLLERLGPERTRLCVLENSYHMVCLDFERQRVASLVLEQLGLSLPQPGKG